MSDAMLALVSAVSVVVLKGLFDYIMQRRKRRDDLEDAETEEARRILEAIRSFKTDIKEEMDFIRAAIHGTREEVADLAYRQERSEAIQCRVRFMLFADELVHGEPRHSKDHYEQTMEDIKDYMKYCEKHPEFKNDITEASIELIQERFKEHLRKNDFL